MSRVDLKIWQSRDEWLRYYAQGYEALRNEYRRRIEGYSQPVRQFLDFVPRRDAVQHHHQETPFSRMKHPGYYYDTARKLRDDDRANWIDVDLRLINFAGRMLKHFDKRRVPLFVYSAFRSDQDQRAMVARRVSKTLPPRAPHCAGCAVDIVSSIHGWDLTDAEWQGVGKVGKDIWQAMQADMRPEHRCEIVWGGDWSFFDPAHWELRHWRDVVLTPRELQYTSEQAPMRLTRKAMLDQPPIDARYYGIRTADVSTS